MVNQYINSRDEKERIRKVLYYPLFLACRGIIEVIDDYENLGEIKSRELFLSFSKILDRILFERSIIYLKEDELKQFLLLKNIIDRQDQIFEARSWEYVKKSLNNDEFKKVKQY